ncbi:hypothetical protein DM02DRAFT_729135 [Periconia macrospinosa]|uniref:Uncharacterized protein n=1 Tax=Periconia macrospinosa TaxID=97972 RepID=A0A2V1DNX8_9PLEO|nr:hypothetical protein DM02DRAFT_729135 [Periconia macrospinosa]
MARYFVLALLATTHFLVSAAPAPVPNPDSIDDLLKYGLPKGTDLAKLGGRSISERSAELQRRGRNQNSLFGALPGCGDEDDPSYASGPSKYKDGEGTEVKSGLCDNGKYIGGWHCWTDMFFTHVQIEYDEWTNTGGVIDCSTTSSCSLQGVSLNQSCTANAQSWDNAIQGGVEGKVDFEKSTKWGLGGKLMYQHNFGGSQTFLTCNSVADQGSCSWDDKGCHAIWKGKRNRRVFGYVRRSCDKGRSGTNMSEKRADGYYTVGMLDFDIVLPDNQAIGCAARCNDVKYPDPRPGGPPQKVPFPGN